MYSLQLIYILIIRLLVLDLISFTVVLKAIYYSINFAESYIVNNHYCQWFQLLLKMDVWGNLIGFLLSVNFRCNFCNFKDWKDGLVIN